MYDRTPDTAEPGDQPDELPGRQLDELEATVHSGGFWRLVPERVPRIYDPVTQDLLERVLHALRRRL